MPISGNILTDMRYLPLLLLGTVAAGLSSCTKSSTATARAEWWRLEARRVELEKSVELQRLQLDRYLSGLAEREKVVSEAEATALQAAELAAEKAELRSDLAALAEDTATAREQSILRARSAAIGLEFPTFEGRGGRKFIDARIVRVTDMGVEIRHRDGSARIAATDLSPADCERFGLDAGLAAEARDQELAEAQEYSKWIDRTLADQAAARKTAALEKERQDQQDRARRAAAAVATTTASAPLGSRSRLNESRRSFGVIYNYASYRPYRYYQVTPCYRPCLSPPRPGFFATAITSRPGAGGVSCRPIFPSRATPSAIAAPAPRPISVSPHVNFSTR